VDQLVAVGYDPKMGARPLGRKIDELVKVPLSKKILFENLTNCHVTADWCKGKGKWSVVLTTKPKANIIGAEVNNDGIVVVNNDQD
jgi:ATP-dependent Clp protease ATP-binding subunit ClpA